MSPHSHRRSLLKKTLQVGSSTMVSRVLGFVREMLQVRYLGVGAAADAFITAFRIPNSLRKMFAEGALSAAFVPAIVGITKDQGQLAASRLLSRVFWMVESGVLIACVLLAWNAHLVIHFIVPGFSAEQIAYAIPFLRILIFFIFFISISALASGALQAVHNFFVPAFGQVILNSVIIVGLIACLYGGWAFTAYAWIIIAGGAIQAGLSVYAYLKQGFVFARADDAAKAHARNVLYKFLPCLVSAGAVEISLFIDAQCASYLHTGSIALFTYAYGFMRMPLGVFVVAFSTITLSHFARVGAYAPKRLSYFLFEACKFFFWVLVPVVFLMSFFAEDIFRTLYLSDNFSYAHVLQAKNVLIILMQGLFFHSINKILLNMCYALHETHIPSIIAIACTALNTLLNFVLMRYMQLAGIAVATTVAAVVQTLLLVWVLYAKFHFKLYVRQFGYFVARAVLQQVMVGTVLIGTVYGIKQLLQHSTYTWAYLFVDTIGFWVWVGPLCGIAALFLWYTRHFFNVHLYFLD